MFRAESWEGTSSGSGRAYVHHVEECAGAGYSCTTTTLAQGPVFDESCSLGVTHPVAFGGVLDGCTYGLNAYMASVRGTTTSSGDCEGEEEVCATWGASPTSFECPPLGVCPPIDVPAFGEPLSGSRSYTDYFAILPLQTDVSWYIVPDDSLDDPCKRCGSVIAGDNQSFEMDVPIAGTPFWLHYQSDRWPGTVSSEGLGGWTLNVQHAFQGQRLYLGNGDRRSAEEDLGEVDPVWSDLPGIVPADGYLIASREGDEVYALDMVGRHLRTLDPLTGAVLYEFEYDAQQRLAAVVDAHGQATIVERDSHGRPTAVVSPTGQRTELGLNSDGYLAWIASPAGETHDFDYSPTGLMTNAVDPRGFQHHLAYDLVGRLEQDADPAGGLTVASRTTTTNGFTVAMTSALGRTTKYKSTQLAGGVTKRTTTQPNGLKNIFTKWPDGRRRTKFADGSVVTWTEEPDPRWGEQTLLRVLSTLKLPSGLVSTQTQSRTILLADPDHPFSLSLLTDTMNLNGRVYSCAYTASNRTLTVTSPEGRISTATLNSQGQTTTARLGELAPVLFTYDGQGRLVTAQQGALADTRIYQFQYDSLGYLIRMIDPLQRTNSYAHDAVGRLTQEILPDGRFIGYAYDAAGNLVSVTPSGRPSHAFHYDPAGIATNYLPPGAVPAAGSTRFHYNADRQLERLIRADGQTVDFLYDSDCGCGRLSALATPRGTNAFSYLPTTGNLGSITSSEGMVLSFVHDGLLLTAQSWSGPVNGQVSSVFDVNLREVSQSVNGAHLVTFEYDQDDLLTRAGDLYLTRLADSGLVASTSLGGVTEIRHYNSFGEMTTNSFAFGGTTLFAAGFTHDKQGRITARSETIGGVTDVYVYSYDLAGRLTQVTKNGSPQFSYTYDQNGNRLSVVNSSGTLTATYDSQDRLLQYGETTYSYTACGELLSKLAGLKTTTYEHDTLGNLVKVVRPSGQVIEYLLDGRQRRVGRKIDGALIQSFLYQDDLRIVAELDSSHNVISRFVHGSRPNIPDYMVKGGITYRIIADHLGSPRLVVDIATGSVAQRIDYDAFGRVMLDTSPGFQPFGFAGGLYERRTKLLAFGARDYDPRTGRWTAKDPILFGGGDANLYAYVRNDPVNLIDPTGLEAIVPPQQLQCRPTPQPAAPPPKGPVCRTLDLKDMIKSMYTGAKTGHAVSADRGQRGSWSMQRAQGLAQQYPGVNLELIELAESSRQVNKPWKTLLQFAALARATGLCYNNSRQLAEEHYKHVKGAQPDPPGIMSQPPAPPTVVEKWY